MLSTQSKIEMFEAMQGDADELTENHVFLGGKSSNFKNSLQNLNVLANTETKLTLFPSCSLAQEVEVANIFLIIFFICLL